MLDMVRVEVGADELRDFVVVYRLINVQQQALQQLTVVFLAPFGDVL